MMMMMMTSKIKDHQYVNDNVSF